MRKAALPLVEFVNRGDFSNQVFSELSRYFSNRAPETILEGGSIVDVATAGVLCGLWGRRA